ncbi:anti-phage-associated DUF1156 domain-containing protein [Sinorhizobium fredii]|uniref:anti-phage-associated DUF1156 domain-containing protein n=1 Tax=Rhizobium fredii TaxID=380 RepID=UPI0004B42D7A|nr:anti-phage-associated DUF1156 domain-containing protein [Sinorhizobium fredii]AWI62470.1 hypothetical protein AB395_00006848 [Sinorhizobium fredii CCBAU 45436]
MSNNLALALSGREQNLAHAPSLIERLWPSQKLSAEAQKERKAGSGQTLTALGAYWKGRKPLLLVRACVLAALLPATDDAIEDLAVFEMLMRIDDEAFAYRDNVTKAGRIAALALSGTIITREELPHLFDLRGRRSNDVATLEEYLDAVGSARLVWRLDKHDPVRVRITAAALATQPYIDRVSQSLRPEELGPEAYEKIWPRVNRHLGTCASTLGELVEQLGQARFGRRPRVADTFAGGGSIPFEAARVGCDSYASDLNPVSCMLTWGALNVIGCSKEQRFGLDEAEAKRMRLVEDQVRRSCLEVDEHGNRAKSYLYCLETRCPSSGWLVPLLSTLVISKPRGVVARLIPDAINCRYDIRIEQAPTGADLQRAEVGTVQNGFLVHEVDGEVHRTSLKTIRGDYRAPDGSSRNRLRPWERTDFTPRSEDIFQERLYCIQWVEAESIGKSRPATFFAAPTAADLENEMALARFVERNLATWQAEGLVPDMIIEPGEKTAEPIRTRGWTHWHHLFGARQLALIVALRAGRSSVADLLLPRALDYTSKLCRWDVGHAGSSAQVKNVFSNQALNTLYTYAAKSSYDLVNILTDVPHVELEGSGMSVSKPVQQLESDADIFITDPPYADAVHYHEITEFFIGWLRRNPPSEFACWTWDSRRGLAIQGEGESFRREMTQAYRTMTNHMPDNGLQVVMFTHQSGSVWADLAQIFWGAGLQVQAAWYIATETTSELKRGGYVQGTVILVLRKRLGSAAGYEDEIVQDVRVEVANQIDTLVGLNQSLKGAGRIENLFEDADLQMAGYAAALRVLTGYTKIDGRDMTVEALRPRRKGEVGVVDRMIDYAVGVANEHMVPDGITPRLWHQLKGSERFFLKMVGVEAGGHAKLENYQNFARAFRVPDYTVFMGSMKPNAAKLKRAAEFGPRTGFEITDFGSGPIRAVLFAIDAISREVEPDIVIAQLQDIVADYFRRRPDMIEIAEYLARRGGRDDNEGRAAAVVANLLRNERL